MTIFQSLILGIIQGLTEFLPISSSAHLVITPYLLGWSLSPSIAFIFDVLVQVGTLVAVIVYFWQDLWQIGLAMLEGVKNRQFWRTSESRLGWLILLATIPAGIFGYLVKDQIEAAFKSPSAAAFFLFITGTFLVIAERAGQRTRELEDLSWKDSLWIGIFQAFAVFPGISRSGSTIAGAMLRNITRPSAARFSFLMSIPIMLAAGGVAAVDLIGLAELNESIPVILTGFVTSALVGYFSIRWLIRYLSHHSLVGFAVYCFILGLVVLLKSLVL